MSPRANGSSPRIAVKAEAEESQPRLAVLIDADNAQAAIIDGLLAEIAKYGVASVKRIYGDWTQPQLSSWKAMLLQHSIQPIQQFGYTKGKNATDSALIIDAMDLLYTGSFGGFCLVSSDSDFTRLASRLREEGLTVYGFGEQKTPQPFVSACDRFIYTEVLRSQGDVTPEAVIPEEPNQPIQREKLIKLIANAVDAVSGDDGWAHLAAVGSNLRMVSPGFDPRLFGFKKFSELVASFPESFEIDARSLDEGVPKVVYVRRRGRDA